MPVRIYDISKKLGLENKEVLTKAKSLGIGTARVASSSLDKITAEYLEQQLILDHPNLAAPAPAAPAEAAPVHEPIRVISAPAEQQAVTGTGTAVLDEEKPADNLAAVAEAQITEPGTVEPEVEVETKAPPSPPEPAGPKVGDKVGFIQLPPKPGAKARRRFLVQWRGCPWARSR